MKIEYFLQFHFIQSNWSVNNRKNHNRTNGNGWSECSEIQNSLNKNGNTFKAIDRASVNEVM